MPVELSHPEGLLRQDLYAPLAVATGSRMLFLAGQTATAPDGSILAADDLAGQVHASMRFVVLAIRAAGGAAADIARLTCYFIDWSAEKAAAMTEGFARAQREEGVADPLPPITVIGVQALYRPEILVEIEAIAVVA